MKVNSEIICWSLIIYSALTLLPFPLLAQQAPHEIGGISLGTNIASYPNITQSNYLKEVVVTNQHGFRKGVISYGTCLHKDLILKIDMKYNDKSKAFYLQLLQNLRRKFGEPDSWHGDSFGVLYLWKWHFIDQDQNKISLALQYNGQNSDETLGSMVKLSMPGKIEEERVCFMKMCEQMQKKSDFGQADDGKDVDWPSLLPH